MGLELAGKHRGKVLDNADPEKLGRLKVQVLSAYGEQPKENLPWAWPCFPAGGSSDCGFFSLPEIGANVWVEFQWNDGEPDPSSPVWSGVWFSRGNTPGDVAGAPEDAHYYTVIKSATGKHRFIMYDKPGEEYIKLYHGTKTQILRFEADGSAYVDSPQGDVHLNKEV